MDYTPLPWRDGQAELACVADYYSRVKICTLLISTEWFTCRMVPTKRARCRAAMLIKTNNTSGEPAKACTDERKLLSYERPLSQ